MKVKQIKKGIWVASVRTQEGATVEFASRVGMVDAIILAIIGMGWEVQQ
jgi:hypothetical protein